MRIIFTAFAVLLIITRSNAQLADSAAPHLLLRTSLLAPIESDANVELGLGVQWKSRWAAMVDAGYIFANTYINRPSEGEERDRVSGLKLRTEFRYYFQDITYRKRTTFYIAPVFHYKKVTTERWAEFGMNCVNGNCAYFQIDTYKRIKREFGGMLTIGSYSPLFGSDRVALETFIGLGIKSKRFRDTDFPANSTVFGLDEGGWFSFDNDGNYPMFPVGFKVSYRLY